MDYVIETAFHNRSVLHGRCALVAHPIHRMHAVHLFARIFKRQNDSSKQRPWLMKMFFTNHGSFIYLADYGFGRSALKSFSRWNVM